MLTTTHQVDLDGAFPEAPAALGRLGEDLAVDHLRLDDGCVLVSRNWRIARGGLRGELDVVAYDPAAGALVVCEVKTRRAAQRFGGAVAALSPAKAARVRALAAVFLRESARGYRHVRFDLIAVDLGPTPRLTHLPGAW